MSSFYDFAARYGLSETVVSIVESTEFGRDETGRKLKLQVSSSGTQGILYPGGKLPVRGERKRYPFKNMKGSRLNPVSRYGPSGDTGYYHEPAKVPWTCWVAKDGVSYDYICQKVDPKTGKVRTVRVRKDPEKVKKRNQEYRQWLKVKREEERIGKKWRPSTEHRVQFNNWSAQEGL